MFIASKQPRYPHPQHLISGELAGKIVLQLGIPFQIIEPHIWKKSYCIFALVIVRNDGDFGEEFKADFAWYFLVLAVYHLHNHQESLEIPARHSELGRPRLKKRAAFFPATQEKTFEYGRYEGEMFCGYPDTKAFFFRLSFGLGLRRGIFTRNRGNLAERIVNHGMIVMSKEVKSRITFFHLQFSPLAKLRMADSRLSRRWWPRHQGQLYALAHPCLPWNSSILMIIQVFAIHESLKHVSLEFSPHGSLQAMLIVRWVCPWSGFDQSYAPIMVVAAVRYRDEGALAMIVRMEYHTNFRGFSNAWEWAWCPEGCATSDQWWLIIGQNTPCPESSIALDWPWPPKSSQPWLATRCCQVHDFFSIETILF